MKKFLSLVLALVMTMSLVTIGASATDYSDLTDKGEVQYEEAVAVLNKLGIITGYEDGSFKPTGALTRGAAAKIIVSLMIGSEAAANLTVAAAPYKDVATTNTFAGVISYCKTAGYINGYADGTFRPTTTLTGYAFAKMLLGALGYDGKIEGFTGSGWTMNVAKLGKVAGLFDDFKTSFQGNNGVTREGACLLALNTLKATEVEYVGGSSVSTSAGNATTNVVINAERQYKTSNNSNINQNIGKNKANDSSEFTLEFGEDHFTDLKLAAEGSARDDFGRPSNKWTLKNVTIGTYAITPDYTFTSRASGDTTTDKLKDMGLNDFNTVSNTSSLANGVTGTREYVNGDTNLITNGNQLAKTSIPGLTGNGRLVEVYLDDDNADQIDTVVVVDTFVMQVKKVTSSGVTLKNPESNRVGTTLNEIKSDDDCFAALKDLKADAYVLVNVSGSDVKSVVIPQTVTGSLTGFVTGTHNSTGVNKITVAGTAYNLALQADSADSKLSSSTKLSSNSNTTVYLDTYGNVIYATDVESGSDYFIFDDQYSSVIDGKIVHYATGFDMNGKAVSLNFGTSTFPSLTPGGVYEYQSETSNNAEYAIKGGFDFAKVGTNAPTITGRGTTAKILNGTVRTLTSGLSGVDTNSDGTVDYYFDGSMQFLYVGWDTEYTDVSGVTMKSGYQKLDTATQLFYVLNDAGTRIKYVVVMNDNDVEVSADVLYVKSASGTVYNDNKTVSQFDAYIDGTLQTGLIASKDMGSSFKGHFYTYTVTDGVYTLHEYTNTTKNTSVRANAQFKLSDVYTNTLSNNAYLAKGLTDTTGTVLAAADLNVKNADVIDCSGNGWNMSSLEDVHDLYAYLVDNYGTTFANNAYITLAFVYNGSSTSSTYGTVATMYIRDLTAGIGGASISK